jgi:hypothetical protein
VKLSVVMPVYNEASTTAEAVKSVRNVDYPCEMELIIVDDGGTDRTREVLVGFQHEHIVTCRHASNRGKGAAIRTAAQAATGDYIIICDADTWICDLETCFKLMPLALNRKLDIRSAGSGMEAEVTGKLLKCRQSPYEVASSYQARSREEGKRLTWRDGVEALWILAKARVGST